MVLINGENLNERIGIEKIRLFRATLLAWYRQSGRKFHWRKKSISYYEKVVSEVLLQRTRAETVASFFPAFLRRFPSWVALASATEDEIGLVIKPIGLWQRRATSLSLLAKEMVRRQGRFPLDRQEIESLPGVGQYVANAIQLFCHGKPMPLIDVNMARVLERYFGPRQLSDIRHDPYLQKLSQLVVACPEAREINWAVLDFAAAICTARNPKHETCPLNETCFFMKKHDDV